MSPAVPRTPLAIGVRRFLALLRKESLQVVRDPSSLLIAFVLPLMLLFLFGYALSLDTNHTRIGLVVEQNSPVVEDLAASFSASGYFDVVVGRDRREFEPDLMVGRLRGIIVIPARFAADLATAGAPEVEVIVDGTEPNTAAFVQSHAAGVVSNWARLRAASSGVSAGAITPQPRFWFNPELKSRNFLVPGAIAIVMTMIGTLLTSLVVAREWERGTMEAMMATPVSAVALMVGKLLPYFVLALISMTLCLVLSLMLFGMPFRGSLLALYALSAAFLVPSLGQGLLISATTKNQFLASQLALMSGFLPSFLLSGFLFEIASMPEPIQWVTYVVPARYFIPSLQSVFLAGDIWPMFLSAIARMLAIGAVFFLIALRNSRKRIA